MFWGPSALPAPRLPPSREVHPASKYISDCCLVQKPHPDRSSPLCVQDPPPWVASLSWQGLDEELLQRVQADWLGRRAGVAGDSIGKESCKAGSYSKPGWQEPCAQGDRCCQLSGRMGMPSIFEEGSWWGCSKISFQIEVTVIFSGSWGSSSDLTKFPADNKPSSSLPV